MEYKIYILRTVEDTSPRYVGITSSNLKTRLNKHIHDIKRDSCKNLHKKNWLLKYTSWNKGIPMSDEMKESQRIAKIGKKDSEETRLKKSMSSKSHLRKKPVECLIDNNWIEFTSAKDAAINLNLNRTKIILVCNGKRNHTGGYIFRYKNITVE